MKNKWIKLLSLFVVFFGISFSASAQIYVRVRPPAPVIVRPAQPSRVHVWINREWEPEGKSYKYSGGHWDAPPHHGDRYNHGHWKHNHEGHVWIHGGWRSRK